MIAILLVPIGLAFLLLVAAYEGYFGLALDAKIRVADGFNVICTTILALAIQYFLARRNSEESALRSQSTASIEALLSSLKDLQQSVSDAISDGFPPPEKTGKIVYAFTCIEGCLMMLDLTLDDSISASLKERNIDLAGKVLACKRQITGENFPKRVSTYADVELVSSLRYDISKEIVTLQRRALHGRSFAMRQWKQFLETVEQDSRNLL